MQFGKCKLCLLDKPLCESHLLPRAAYDYCRVSDGDPVVGTSKLLIQSSRQLQHPLLCEDCELILNKGGEDWLVPLFARYDGTFGFFEFFKTMTPDVTEDGFEGYAAVRNPDIKADQLIHFALGLVWKSAVHSWSGSKSAPLIELGPYREALRTFLLGKTEFPCRMALVIAVLRPPVKAIAFLNPFRTVERAYHRFYFYTSGILWTLSVGKAVNEELRKTCFAANPARPILVGDLEEDVQEVFGTAFKNARRARNIDEFLKRVGK